MNEAFQMALSTPDGTAIADAAKAVCMARGIPAYSMAITPIGGLTAWQGIIFEAAMMRAISGMLRG